MNVRKVGASLRFAKQSTEPRQPTGELALKLEDLELRRREVELKEASHRATRWSNPLVIAVLGAGLAAGSNAWVSHRNGTDARSLETLRWKQSVQTERDRVLASSVTEFSKNLAKAYQQATWILWKHVYGNQRVDRGAIASYDSAMKEILPATFASYVHLGTQDPALVQQLKPLLEHVSQLDSQIARAFAAPKVDKESLEQLQSAAAESTMNLATRVSTAVVRREKILDIPALPRTIEPGRFGRPSPSALARPLPPSHSKATSASSPPLAASVPPYPPRASMTAEPLPSRAASMPLYPTRASAPSGP